MRMVWFRKFAWAICFLRTHVISYFGGIVLVLPSPATATCTSVGAGDRSTSVSPTHMEIFTFRFHTWCRLHGINHSQPWITKGHLNLTDYAELRLKAFASRIMTSFLAVVLTNLQREKSCVGQSSVDLDLVALATTQFSNWSLLVEEYPHALSDEQADKLYHDGRKLLWLHTFNPKRSSVGNIIAYLTLMITYGYWILS